VPNLAAKAALIPAADGNPVPAAVTKAGRSACGKVTALAHAAFQAKQARLRQDAAAARAARKRARLSAGQTSFGL
jgi:hypothetical protein